MSLHCATAIISTMLYHCEKKRSEINLLVPNDRYFIVQTFLRFPFRSHLNAKFILLSYFMNFSIETLRNIPPEVDFTYQSTLHLFGTGTLLSTSGLNCEYVNKATYNKKEL